MDDQKLLLYTLMDSIPDPIYFKDAEGRFTMVNEAMASKLGCSDLRDLIGKDEYEFLCAEAADQLSKEDKAVLLSGDPVINKESKVTWADGRDAWVSTTRMPLRDGVGKITGVYAVSRDISHRKQIEQDLRDANTRLSDAMLRLKKSQLQTIQHERLSALGQMASGVAHSFNNALMPILGFSDLLVDDPSLLDNRKETIAMLVDIRDAARGAAEAVKRLRDFYKPPDSEGFKHVQVNEIIKDVIERTKPKWKEEVAAQGIKIDLSARLTEESTGILGDDTQLREVITNLLLNAVDAMPEGGVLAIETSCDGGWLFVSVRDTGTGMHDDVKRLCLEPFYTTKGVYGTGMGLSVAYGIVQRHRGSLEILSEYGKGTNVIVRLPLQERVEEEAVESGPPPRNLCVLVVDDDHSSRDVASHCMVQMGQSVETAANGEEAIRLLEESSFDLLLTDQAMPDMSGVQLAEIVRAKTPGIKVILVTGFGDMMRVKGDMPSGIDVILPKPVTRSQLEDAIKKLYS